MNSNIAERQKNKVFRIAVLGMSAALSIALIYLIHFPIFPPVSFLEYDPGDIPIFICTFMFGTVPGLILTAIASIIQGLTVSSSSGIIGIIMHILATGSYVLTAGLIRRRDNSPQHFAVACVAGSLVMTVTMMLWNLIFTPFYMHVDVGVIVGLLPYIAAFNIIKAGGNSIVAAILYKVLHKTVLKNYLSDM